jgi:hypothetical protein
MSGGCTESRSPSPHGALVQDECFTRRGRYARSSSNALCYDSAPRGTPCCSMQQHRHNARKTPCIAGYQGKSPWILGYQANRGAGRYVSHPVKWGEEVYL